MTDFSQIALAAIHVDSAAQQCAMNPSDENKGFIKHFMLNSIRSNFVAHKAKFGQMVIATDSNTGYWRRDYFPNYKCQRRAAKSQDTSGIQWPWVMGVMDELIVEMHDYFPFPIIRVDRAEGDDVIGVLTKYFSESPQFQTEDIMGDMCPPEILILSSDRDNSQMHRYKNVRQWSPRDKKFIKPENGWKKALIEKIIKGEAGASSDSIPNIRSSDDIFLQEGVRQSPISQKRLDEFFVAKDLKDACLDDSERKNLLRNQTLVDYNFIPSDISEAIISEYNKQASKKTSKMALMNYFTSNRMSNLLGVITDFYI